MTFQELNQNIEKCRSELEIILQDAINAEEELDMAKIALVKAEARKKKLRFQTKIAEQNLDSYKEMSWNLRREAKL